jgi:hypothetical protein
MQENDIKGRKMTLTKSGEVYIFSLRKRKALAIYERLPKLLELMGNCIIHSKSSRSKAFLWVARESRLPTNPKEVQDE